MKVFPAVIRHLINPGGKAKVNRSEENSLKRVPELLAPAGSRESLEAAIEGGADAVYLGLSQYGARAYAKNFTVEGLSEAARLAHSYGVSVYVTMNTLVFDRELDDWLRLAYRAAEAGADALIVADVGAISLCRRYFPEIRLHGSTQMTCHNAEGAEEIARLGCSRVVIARELPFSEAANIIGRTEIETEMFVHGALCVSVSGQCLMSSMIGGRSGNRGECAQPCRLPYGKGYPLSLKDLCLARHIPEIISSRVDSLKIEGRMKSPDYVLGVTRVYRKLIDENRAATAEEIKEMSGIFSRSGFTDGYYSGHKGHEMLGTRSREDKDNTEKKALGFTGLTRKIGLDLNVTLRPDMPSRLEVSAGNGKKAVVFGEVCEKAVNVPLTEETVKRNLGRFGGTIYRPDSISVDMAPGVMLRISQLNSLRRAAVEELEKSPDRSKHKEFPKFEPLPGADVQESRRFKVAVFEDPGQIPDSAFDYFDELFIPLGRYDGSTGGFLMPAVIYPGEMDRIEDHIERAARLGAKTALAENVSQLGILRKSGLNVMGGMRLNITNNASARYYMDMGVCSFILSPEMSLPQIRDIRGNKAAVVYGRIPLMLTEKCVISELCGCKGNGCPEHATLTDRTGAGFPVRRADSGEAVSGCGKCRNEILNSVPVYMADRRDQLDRYDVRGWVFLFSDESRQEAERIIKSFAEGEPMDGAFRRIRP